MTRVRIFQRPRGAEACGACADDGDVDFREKGHDVVYLVVMPALVAGIHVFLFQYPRRGWPGQARP
jgi:hypothetical protein